MDITKQQKITERLDFLYGDDVADWFIPELEQRAQQYRTTFSEKPFKHQWDENDITLITYGDSIISQEQKAGLSSLKAFADKYFNDYFSIIHLLPIFPFTSDDGFSVSDYRAIRNDLGDWEDVGALGENFDLMFDFVLNHCSRLSLYFSDFRAKLEPYKDFFIYEDPDKDWSKVVRPRSSSHLTEIPTHDGTRHAWTTFSADQVDLNYKNPRVLLEMLDILLFYISRGSRITRLDAIAFLWKEAGTSCLHLPQTHEVVKLLRDVVDDVSPGAILLTETNVPHEENISYFGQGDEAQMVYQFSLPPLLLHAIHTSNTEYLYGWLKELTPPPEGCTYFNFTASHDGIGVRPLEGLLPDREFEQLLDDMRANGAYVSTRRNTDGDDVPYEINVTYFDAFRSPGQQSSPWQVARFLLSQTVALSMRGIPGIYIHSLLATPNNHKGVEMTGSTRSINRYRWDENELNALLKVPESSTCLSMNEYLRRIKIRCEQSAFHPDAEQMVLDLGSNQVLGIVRTSVDSKEHIVALYNFSKDDQLIPATVIYPFFGKDGQWKDLLQDTPPEVEESHLVLKPYASLWLTKN